VRSTYGQLWREVAAAVGDRVAVTSGERALTYRELEREAARLAGLLRAHGIGRGDTVAIYAYNCPEYLSALFAALTLGAAPAPLNFRSRAGELAGLLAEVQATALVYPRSLADAVTAAADRTEAPELRLRLEVDDDAGARPAVPGAVPFDAPAEEHRPEIPDDGRLLLCTGGTTGRPKAVVWSVADLFEAQQYATYGTLGLPVPGTLEAAIGVASDAGTPHVVVMPLAPFMHGTALFNSMNVLSLGGTVVVLASPRLDAEAAIRLARDQLATRWIIAGDAVARPLLEAVEADAADAGPVLPHLDSVISSGMRLSDDVKARLHALGDVTISDFLASTEGGPYAVAVSGSADDLPARLRLFPGAVVLDAAHQEVQDMPGAVGVLGFRGALPQGYLGDPGRTAETFPVIGGRRHVVPGDYVQVLGEGYVELLGRGSAVVNSGGEKIYPAEVEEALLSHPEVTDAVILGLPDRRWGEAVTAVVALRAGSAVTAGDLTAHVGRRLAGYKKPKRVVLREQIERSPTGKVDLRALRAQLTSEPG